MSILNKINIPLLVLNYHSLSYRSMFCIIRDILTKMILIEKGKEKKNKKKIWKNIGKNFD